MGPRRLVVWEKQIDGKGTLTGGGGGEVKCFQKQVLLDYNKYCAFVQCCYNVGPASSTAAQQKKSIG